MRDYRTKDVTGLICDVNEMKPKKCMVTVQMTSDDIGQSLSLSAYNILIEIPLEAVTDIIKVSERREND